MDHGVAKDSRDFVPGETKIGGEARSWVESTFDGGGARGRRFECGGSFCRCVCCAFRSWVGCSPSMVRCVEARFGCDNLCVSACCVGENSGSFLDEMIPPLGLFLPEGDGWSFFCWLSKSISTL